MLQTEGERQRGYVDVTCNVRMCSIFWSFTMDQPKFITMFLPRCTTLTCISVLDTRGCQYIVITSVTRRTLLLMASMIYKYLLENCSCHLVTLNMHDMTDISSPWTSANVLYIVLIYFLDSHHY